MRVLFIHNNFPAQYRHIAQVLAKDPRNRVGFLTQNRDQTLPGVTKLIFEPARKAHAGIHHYLRQFETAVLDGQAVFRKLQELKARGFIPDLICAHTGWGVGMFIKDIFPDTPLLLYCEWYTQSRGGDLDFDPAYPSSIDDLLRYRVSNAAMLVDLEACDGGVSPTHWQRSRFPRAFQSCIDVLHDGMDTEYFSPQPGTRLRLPDLDLSTVREIVTYSARGMDAYRGFPQFIEALGKVLAQRPECHAVIVGEDRVAYGPPPPSGSSYKQWMLERVPLDPARVHFVGRLPYELYRQVLRASTVHVYLTRPFVLSWSMLEAMATGCLVVASNTAPVREVIEDGVNGLLVDFFDISGIARRIEEALENSPRLDRIRERARQTVLERYALAALLPRHLELLERYAQS